MNLLKVRTYQSLYCKAHLIFKSYKMSLFKNIRVELLVLLIISLNIFISFNLDLGLYNYFKDFNKNLNSVYLKEFFVDITRLGSSSWYFAISIIGFGVSFI